jgi:ethanolamine utilization protein EutN
VRIGEVIGRLTLSPVDANLRGGRFLMIRPHDPSSLREGRLGGGDVVVAYDELGAGVGDRVGFSEGREAAMPFHPTPAAIDAYVACLLDSVTYG